MNNDPLTMVEDNRRETYRLHFGQYAGFLNHMLDNNVRGDNIDTLDEILTELNISPAEARLDRDVLKRARELAEHAAKLPALLGTCDVAKKIFDDFTAKGKSMADDLDTALQHKEGANTVDYDRCQKSKATIAMEREPEAKRLGDAAGKASGAVEAARVAAKELAGLRKTHPMLLAEAVPA